MVTAGACFLIGMERGSWSLGSDMSGQRWGVNLGVKWFRSLQALHLWPRGPDSVDRCSFRRALLLFK